MTTRSQCRLLSLPLEIRREIFLYVLTPVPKLHFYLEDGRPCVSPCLGANLGKEDYNERAVAPLPGVTRETRSKAWARRLSSTWANHYMCEEVRDGKRFSDHPVREAHGYTYTLLICRQM